ncbi:hypothetical protein AB9K66_30170 (plasmid) [Klebsiella pneumoniae]
MESRKQKEKKRRSKMMQ